jgi:hypothetical protein
VSPSRIAVAGLLTGVTDGLFACVLSAGFYHSTVTRLWQGVASTLLGPAALEGGTRTAAVGVLMHFGVAFAWSAVFLAIFNRSERVRRVVRLALRRAEGRRGLRAVHLARHVARGDSAARPSPAHVLNPMADPAHRPHPLRRRTDRLLDRAGGNGF